MSSQGSTGRPERITTHGEARYEVMGVDDDLWETLTHIRYTCEHVRFTRPIVRDRVNHVIFRATPLLRTATPSRVWHSPVPTAPIRQRDSLQSSASDPSVAHTSRRKMASKPPRQPPRGESRNRRSDASTKQIKPLLATAWSTGVVYITPK